MGINKLSDAVLKMYAPEVRLHPDETNRPASVEFYLPRVRMTYGEDLIVMTTLTGTDPVASEDIQAVTVNNITEFEYKGHFSNDEKTGKEFRLKMIGADGSSYQEETRAGQDYRKVGSGYEVHTDMVPCYVRVNAARSTQGVYDISYYFFFPQNGATGALEYGAHQGDFEMIIVRIKERAVAGTYDVLGVNYVAHGGNRWYYPSEAGRPESVYATTADGHPIVFTAKQSHASYPTTGTRTTGGGAQPPRIASAFGAYIRIVRLNGPFGAGSQLASLPAPGLSFWK